MADEFDKHMKGKQGVSKKKKENILDIMRHQELSKKRDQSKAIKKGGKGKQGRKGGKSKGKGKSRRGRK